MTAAMLIKNSGRFINLGHWAGGIVGVAATALAGQGDEAASIFLIAQVIWAIVERISMGSFSVKWLLIITTEVLST